MTTKELKLEVGKSYKTRGGGVTKITAKIENHVYPFKTSEGLSVLPNGSHSELGASTTYDLIEEVMEEAPKVNIASEAKFSVGDTVYCIMHGLGYVNYSHPGRNQQLFVVFETCDDTYTLEGKRNRKNAHPILLTLEEARAKGYHTPKQKKSKTISVIFNYAHDVVDISRQPVLFPVSDSVVKDVTFEWEE